MSEKTEKHLKNKHIPGAAGLIVLSTFKRGDELDNEKYFPVFEPD
jgi:hypothetical protein